MRTTLLLAVALLTAGCCCPRAPSTTVQTSERHFVVIRATPMAADAEGRRQVVIESSTASVSRREAIEAVGRAERLDAAEAPVWLAGTQSPSFTFGRRSLVLNLPSVVSLVGEEAVIEVSDDDSFDGVRMRVILTEDDSGSVAMRLFYKHTQRGKTVHAVPGVPLRASARITSQFQVLGEST